MYLADHVDILPQCRLWLACFDDDADEFLASTTRDIANAEFSDQDLQRWQQYRSAARKRQFLNSRLAVRAVLKREFGKDAEDIRFLSDSLGCPLLLSRANEHVAHVSLSHSENAVAVLISDDEFPVGVDIEVANPRLTDALRFVALHSHEKIWCDLHAGRESEALTTLWTIKESVWKTLQGTHDVSVSDIAVQFEHDSPRPVLCNRPTDGPQFRTQLFVQNSRPVVTSTVCLSTTNVVALQGSVTQRMTISADADRSRQEYLRRI